MRETPNKNLTTFKNCWIKNFRILIVPLCTLQEYLIQQISLNSAENSQVKLYPNITFKCIMEKNRIRSFAVSIIHVASITQKTRFIYYMDSFWKHVKFVHFSTRKCQQLKTH